MAFTFLPLPQRPPRLEAHEPICAAHGVELVVVQQVKGRGSLIVRILIDRVRPASAPRPGSGVSVDDCKAVSRDVSTALDLHDELFPEAGYHLEVSSPGLDRPLVRRRDYDRFAGSEIKVKTFRPIEKRRSFTGTLVAFEGEGDAEGEVLVRIGETTHRIPFEAIAKANLVPQL